METIADAFAAMIGGIVLARRGGVQVRTSVSRSRGSWSGAGYRWRPDLECVDA